MLINLDLKAFLKKTASGSPVPGGGSIAALSASIAASLTEMVANLTTSKKGYEIYEKEMNKIANQAGRFRNQFLDAVDRDSSAYEMVINAYKLPKETNEQVVKRKESIQHALKNAAIVPLEVAGQTFEMMHLINSVIENGNKNAVTDAAVSAMMARTAILSALLNVKINLSSIKDSAFVETTKHQVEKLEDGAIAKEKEMLSKVVI